MGRTHQMNWHSHQCSPCSAITHKVPFKDKTCCALICWNPPIKPIEVEPNIFQSSRAKREIWVFKATLPCRGRVCACCLRKNAWRNGDRLLEFGLLWGGGGCSWYWLSICKHPPQSRVYACEQSKCRQHVTVTGAAPLKVTFPKAWLDIWNTSVILLILTGRGRHSITVVNGRESYTGTRWLVSVGLLPGGLCSQRGWWMWTRKICLGSWYSPRAVHRILSQNL